MLAMSLREAVLLRYLMDLVTNQELVHLRYRLSCKLSLAMADLGRSPRINQHEPTHKE